MNAVQKMQGEVKEQISAIDRKIKDLRAEREKLNQQRLIISNHRYEKEREWGEKIRKFMNDNFQRTRELEDISEWAIVKELRKRGYKGTLENPDKGATPRPSEGRGAEGGVGSASETDAKGAPQATIDRLLAMREPVKLMPVLPQLSKNQRDSLRERSKKLYRRAMFHEQNGCCSLCHKPMAIDKSQMHHVMPLERFPELGVVRGNLMLICADCHFDIHHNPFLDSRLMIERATALGIDLSKRYKLPE